MSVIDRIRARVVVNEHGCHVFQGALDNGYGRVGLGGRGSGTGYTHRLAYEAEKGAIPAGFQIDHLCRNRACCNPEHLEAVTQQVNTKRAAAVKYPGTRGVRKTNQSNTRPWRAEISSDGKTVHLGLFATREEAVAARIAAETATPERRAEIEAEVAKLNGAES